MVLDRKASLMATMPSVAQEDGVDHVLLFVVDILNEQATTVDPRCHSANCGGKIFWGHGHGRYRGLARGNEPQKADHTQP